MRQSKLNQTTPQPPFTPVQPTLQPETVSTGAGKTISVLTKGANINLKVAGITLVTLIILIGGFFELKSLKGYQAEGHVKQFGSVQKNLDTDELTGNIPAMFTDEAKQGYEDGEGATFTVEYVNEFGLSEGEEVFRINPFSNSTEAVTGDKPSRREYIDGDKDGGGGPEKYKKSRQAAWENLVTQLKGHAKPRNYLIQILVDDTNGISTGIVEKLKATLENLKKLTDRKDVCKVVFGKLSATVAVNQLTIENPDVSQLETIKAWLMIENEGAATTKSSVAYATWSQLRPFNGQFRKVIFLTDGAENADGLTISLYKRKEMVEDPNRWPELRAILIKGGIDNPPSEEEMKKTKVEWYALTTSTNSKFVISCTAFWKWMFTTEPLKAFSFEATPISVGKLLNPKKPQPDPETSPEPAAKAAPKKK